VPHQDRPNRHEYVLTEKGRALGPVVQALRGWGKRWTSGDDRSPRPVHAACGHESSLGFHCPACDRALTAEEVTLQAR
jgi:hypothetical protein